MKDIYHYWVQAQETIKNKLQVDGDRARIQDSIEISPTEVKLKGKDSIPVLRNFVGALDESIRSIEAGLDGLEECRQLVRVGSASVHDLKRLDERHDQFKEMLHHCEKIKENLNPVTNNDIRPLLEPELFDLLKRLTLFFGGPPSPPITVTVTYEI